MVESANSKQRVMMERRSPLLYNKNSFHISNMVRLTFYKKIKTNAAMPFGIVKIDKWEGRLGAA